MNSGKRSPNFAWRGNCWCIWRGWNQKGMVDLLEVYYYSLLLIKTNNKFCNIGKMVPDRQKHQLPWAPSQEKDNDLFSDLPSGNPPSWDHRCRIASDILGFIGFISKSSQQARLRLWLISNPSDRLTASFCSAWFHCSEFAKVNKRIERLFFKKNGIFLDGTHVLHRMKASARVILK